MIPFVLFLCYNMSYGGHKMNEMTEVRRNALLKFLLESKLPLTGSCLAQKFQVSRQVIVQDIAVLRAGGYSIMATLQGYYIQESENNHIKKTFISYHNGNERMEEELKIIVDFGGMVLTIAVSHPLYGDIVCPLKIQNREDIREFMLRLSDQKAAPLSSLTEGIHFHTIEVISEASFDKIMSQLKKTGFIPD